jgi:hypothetical protein
MERFTDQAYGDENWWNCKRPQRLTWLYRDMDYDTVVLQRALTGAQGPGCDAVETSKRGKR